MEEHFHNSKKLTKEQLKVLMQKSDHPALFRFILMYLLVIITGTLTVITWNAPLWQVMCAHLGFGIMCCSTFACLHETAHNTAFRSRFLNQLAARLAGIAHVYPAVAFRELHFTHHRYTHVPGKDPEITFGVNPIASVVSNIPLYFGWLTGLPIFLFKCFMIIAGAFGMPEFIRKRIFPFIRPEVRLSLFVESVYILLIYLSFIYLALNVHPGFWALLTGQVIGHCLLASYLTSEHNGLPHEGDIFQRTRSMKTNYLVRLLMWNMPYHAEHHAYPAIPFYALPEVHELLKDEIIHRHENYPGFHFKVLKREIR